MAVDAGTLGDLLDALAAAEDGDTISAGSVVETLDHRSAGAIFAALGLVASMPVIGGIPASRSHSGSSPSRWRARRS